MSVTLNDLWEAVKRKERNKEACVYNSDDREMNFKLGEITNVTIAEYRIFQLTHVIK